MIKRAYFFKDSSCFEYDPRPGKDRVVNGPIPIGTRFKGLNTDFADGIDAAVNWGDGFVYFFKGKEYWKYDALSDRADTATPRKIAAGWPTLPSSFQDGIDAAFNSGTGKAYFFRKDKYLRYDIDKDRVDDPDPGTSPYPRRIADPNGWHGLSPSFQSGIDAAIFAGDGKIYFFTGSEYARLTFASRSVDVSSPPYPLSISPIWNGLPPKIDVAVEWIEAGSATLDIILSSTGCQRVATGLLEALLTRAFGINASFVATGYPSVCGCAEYRQFVRGTITVNGKPRTPLLPDPAGGPDVPMLPRPVPGAINNNFLEDKGEGTVRFYGHRNDLPDPNGAYSGPDQRSGCRYKATDTPHASGTIGQVATIDLDFRGVIIDVSAGNEVLVEKFWTVSCSGVL